MGKPHHRGGAFVDMADAGGSAFYEGELHLISVEIDALSDLKCSPDPLVIIQSDDHAPHPLVLFSNVFFDVTHIPLDLSDHCIAGTSLLQFDNKQLLLVLADGE